MIGRGLGSKKIVGNKKLIILILATLATTTPPLHNQHQQRNRTEQPPRTKNNNHQPTPPTPLSLTLTHSHPPSFQEICRLVPSPCWVVEIKSEIKRNKSVRRHKQNKEDNVKGMS